MIIHLSQFQCHFEPFILLITIFISILLPSMVYWLTYIKITNYQTNCWSNLNIIFKDINAKFNMKHDIKVILLLYDLFINLNTISCFIWILIINRKSISNYPFVNLLFPIKKQLIPMAVIDIWILNLFPKLVYQLNDIFLQIFI